MPKSEQEKCYFCGERHGRVCPEFKNSSKPKKRAKPSNKRCFYCGGPHGLLLTSIFYESSSTLQVSNPSKSPSLPRNTKRALEFRIVSGDGKIRLSLKNLARLRALLDDWIYPGPRQ